MTTDELEEIKGRIGLEWRILSDSAALPAGNTYAWVDILDPFNRAASDREPEWERFMYVSPACAIGCEVRVPFGDTVLEGKCVSPVTSDTIEGNIDVLKWYNKEKVRKVLQYKPNEKKKDASAKDTGDENLPFHAVAKPFRKKGKAR